VLRFHFDEHVSHAVVEGLRARGIDVTSPTESGLLGASDPEHVAYALRTSRAIFTNDEDFLIMAAAEGEHAGIFYCKVGARSIGYIVEALDFFSNELEPDEMMNRVEYL
jgi:predicted nuclease of predicted toxin-antitoxin system